MLKNFLINSYLKREEGDDVWMANLKVNPSDVRRLLFFEYRFCESKNLEGIRGRLKRTFQFIPANDLVDILGEVKKRLKIKYEVSLPKDLTKDAIAMRSLAVDPAMMYFLLLSRDEKGGVLILFETVHSWYTHEKILTSMRAYCKNAGIRCRPLSYTHRKYDGC